MIGRWLCRHNRHRAYWASVIDFAKLVRPELDAGLEREANRCRRCRAPLGRRRWTGTWSGGVSPE